MKTNNEKQLKHLRRLTDNFGITEHALMSIPDLKEGYCVDDNARALIAAVRYKESDLIDIYLKFLLTASDDKGLRNDVSLDMVWDDYSCDENFGRAMAALAETAVGAPEKNQRLAAVFLFDKLSNLINKVRSNRAKSWLIYALYKRDKVAKKINDEEKKYIEVKIGQNKLDKIQQINRIVTAGKLADEICQEYSLSMSKNWKWYEEKITYDNGRIPWGLIYAYIFLKDKKFLKIGLETLDFLTEKLLDTKKNIFIFPGYRGWLSQNGIKAEYGQQPIEAGSMVEVYTLAFGITKKENYKKMAMMAYDWFYGKNLAKLKMIDEESGGVYDGIEKEGINLNQGAESLLAYLIAVKEIQKII